MQQHQFLAQDSSGNRCQVKVLNSGGATGGKRDQNHVEPTYVLEDGSVVKRIDNDTFQVVATGAYITVLRD